MIDLSFFLFYNYIGGTMKKILLIFILILLTGCMNESDNIRFKKEYENSNEEIALTIPEDNYMQYASKEKILDIIKNGTGVIYIGNAKNTECRQIVNTLINAADSTDLKTIYYYNEEDKAFLEEYFGNTTIPTVIFVYEGEIKSFKQGLDTEEILFDAYLDGIHDVLNDICDDDCDD